eukprot:4886884-Prymnesium_polylepis.1
MLRRRVAPGWQLHQESARVRHCNRHHVFPHTSARRHESNLKWRHVQILRPVNRHVAREFRVAAWSSAMADHILSPRVRRVVCDGWGLLAAAAAD